ncbi:MAG: glycosyltransferase family 2 protein [Solirubrobacteraceae bacterium]
MRTGTAAGSVPQLEGDPGRAAEISVVIVSWNSGDDLLNCLRSLEQHPPEASWEAIVVDNGSSDGSIERVRAELPWVRLIVNTRNRGLAAANNQGLMASRAPFALICNPDIVFSAGSIDALLDVLRRRERAAFAVANLRYPDGQPQTSAGSLPSLAEAIVGWRLSRHLPGGNGTRTWWHEWPHDEERSIGHGAEACYLVRRDAVAEIGLQDERFILDWEGIDWSARAWTAGWEIWFSPQAVITHVGGSSVKQVTVRWIASTHLGMYRYFRSRVSPWTRPILAVVVAARAILKLALARTGAEAYALIKRDDAGLAEDPGAVGE